MAYRMLGKVGIYKVIWDPSGKIIVNREGIIRDETVKSFSERITDPVLALQYASRWIKENKS